MLTSVCAVLLVALGAVVTLVDVGTIGAIVAGVVATPVVAVVAVVARSAGASELGERRVLELDQELRDELLHARDSLRVGDASCGRGLELS